MANPAKNVRTLLAPTALATTGNASQSISAGNLTSSGTTATVTLTAHGYSTNDWVRVSGAVQPEYNGVFQVTVTGVNAFTFLIRNTSPTTPATGTIVVQRGLVSSVWFDGTGGSVGALKTAFESLLKCRIVNGSSAPTVAATIEVYVGSGTAGEWLLSRAMATTNGALDDNARDFVVPLGVPAALAFFYGNTANTVTCSAYGYEATSIA